MLGFFWGLLTPLSLLLVMYFIFNKRFGPEVKLYPLYLLVGIICLNFFVTATGRFMTLFLEERDFMMDVIIPPEIVVLAHFFVYLHKFLIELSLAVMMSLFYGILTWRSLLLCPVLLVAYSAFVLGVSLLLAVGYSFFRETEYLWNIGTRILYFATPIFYSLDSVSLLVRRLIYFCNPLTPFIIAFRSIFITPAYLQGSVYVFSIAIGSFFFILGYCVFLFYGRIAIERV